MTMKQVTEYLDKKIEQTIKMLELAKTRLENMNYKVYFTNEKFTYQNMILTVKQNELMIAIKKL